MILVIVAHINFFDTFVTSLTISDNTSVLVLMALSVERDVKLLDFVQRNVLMLLFLLVIFGSPELLLRDRVGDTVLSRDFVCSSLGHLGRGFQGLLTLVYLRAEREGVTADL